MMSHQLLVTIRRQNLCKYISCVVIIGKNRNHIKGNVKSVDNEIICWEVFSRSYICSISIHHNFTFLFHHHLQEVMEDIPSDTILISLVSVNLYIAWPLIFVLYRFTVMQEFFCAASSFYGWRRASSGGILWDTTRLLFLGNCGS